MPATITDERALLRAVLAAPADDLPRLVLADWLEEHGQPERAEFVRVQCEVERLRVSDCGLSVEASHERFEALRRRERKLLPVVRERFMTALVGETGVRLPSPEGTAVVLMCEAAEFRRGFVEAVSCPLAAFVGEECGRCGGSGVAEGADRPFEYEGHGTWPGPCPGPCKGDRNYRVGGCAAALAASQPVTRVALTDREPDGSDNGNHPPFAYYLDALRLQYEPGAPIIPAELFDLLGGNLSPHRSWRDFPTRAAALDALSAACITYARRAAVAAGLVPGNLWEGL
jgi:uncharacterized protein (TIGR02996 family)